jgi:CheY-like chemotaxis protein
MELAREVSPDLILLDIMFAGPLGPDRVEMSRRLRQDLVLRNRPVIILSGAKKLLDMPIKLTPDETYMPVRAFLRKAFKPDGFLSEIEKVLGPAS